MIPQTESTDMKVWEELGWSFTPLNIPPLVVAPPPASVDLRDAQPQDVAPIGDFEFTQPRRRRTIDTLTHRSLLDQSLREYRDIWRTLAER